MPAQPKLAGAAASKYKFATWDEMVAEATVDVPPYEIPMDPENPADVIVIPCPDGDKYVDITRAQLRGDAALMLEAMVPDAHDRERLRIKMRGIHFNIIDVITSNVLRHYLGLTKVDTEDPGNS